MRLALAALSARVLAEAAAADGIEAIALDVFGDADTRRSCTKWLSIGAALCIDPDRFIAALRRAADERATGWVAGAGFESEPDLLGRGAAVLPLLGTLPGAVQRVRDPGEFFEALDRHAIAHPETSLSCPDRLDGWLAKSSRGSGGWHIRRASTARGAGRYWQREQPGSAMSALFVANRRSFTLLGINRLTVRPIGASPYVYCGAIGPFPIAAKPLSGLLRAIGALVIEFELCGLASLDFMLDGETVAVLEVNPRPSASMALYPNRSLRAHLDACLDLALPTRAPPAQAVRGTEIVYAQVRFALTSHALTRLAALPGCHDIPFEPTRFDRNDPLCSVSADGADEAAVRTMLAARCNAVLDILELQ